jgi:hypothetical protein
MNSLRKEQQFISNATFYLKYCTVDKNCYDLNTEKIFIFSAGVNGLYRISLKTDMFALGKILSSMLSMLSTNRFR